MVRGFAPQLSAAEAVSDGYAELVDAISSGLILFFATGLGSDEEIFGAVLECSVAGLGSVDGPVGDGCWYTSICTTDHGSGREG